MEAPGQKVLNPALLGLLSGENLKCVDDKREVLLRVRNEFVWKCVWVISC